ncbi:META domain-containing protein [Chryseobacterium sp. MYb264]|uniref:META domain-containing protein n=1 Tax=Chryseobacterium sp. MYb264 TaxID=2745153 RepID=UPI002E11E687|nr:META domain-containing protein [Chryseobacterium sp. MYb264]
MKKLLLSIFTILVLQMLLNCSSLMPENSINTAKNPHLQREWMMIAFENFTKADLIKMNAKINLTGSAKDGKIHGNAFVGCNNIFFTSEFKNNGKVKISGIGSTEKACQDMKLENDFSKTFKNITNFKVEGHFLTLTDPQGNSMKFIAADWD